MIQNCCCFCCPTNLLIPLSFRVVYNVVLHTNISNSVAVFSRSIRLRGPYLPLEQRIRLYSEVHMLRRKGLSYSQIVKRIQRFSGIRLSSSHISEWVNGKHQPLGNVNKFDGKSSPELAGIIGVVLGDGNRNVERRNNGRRIRLEVTDKDYAEAFGRDLAKVLQKEKPYRPHWSQREQSWTVTARSILLFGRLDKPWWELRPDIEASRACVAHFLRKFFDGESNIEGRTLNVYNTNKELLLYIQRLLRRYFRIETTGPHRSAKAGQRFRGANKKIYKRKKTCYRLYVRVKNLPRFHRYIGFTIARKQRRLAEAIQK